MVRSLHTLFSEHNFAMQIFLQMTWVVSWCVAMLGGGGCTLDAAPPLLGWTRPRLTSGSRSAQRQSPVDRGAGQTRGDTAVTGTRGT